jgi:hypothetical protein|tara:strand:- start:208 stop:3474 length:3267 start_codon:yes stop_codon:yes gene_type:complete
MEQPIKFATPAEEAVTMDNQGRMRVTMDPVSETDADLFSAGAETREPGTAPVEAEPNQRMPSLAHPFVTLAEDAIDADAEYGKYLLASQLRSIGVEPFPEPTQSPDDMMLAGPSGEAQSDGRSISGQVGQAIFKGLDQGGRELMDSFAFLAGAPVEAAKNVINVGLEAVGMEPIKNAFGDIDSMRTVVGAYQNAVNEAIPVPESVRDWASQPYDNEILGGLVEGITQFGVAAVPAAKLVKAMTTYNAAARGFVWGAIADFTAFDPNDPTLANGIINHLQSLPPEEQMPVLQSFLSVMEKYETDSELVKRAKMAMEGGVIGTVVEGAIKVARMIPFQEIADASKRAIGRAGEAADARIAERAADTGVTLGAGVDPMPAVDAAISAAGKAVRRRRINREEREIIKTDIANQKLKDGQEPVDLKNVVNEVERIKNEYPPENGWLPIYVQTGRNLKDQSKRNPVFKVDKDGGLEIRWEQPAYAFHNPPGEKLKGAAGKAQRQAHLEKLVDVTIDEVSAIVERAKSGDQAAIEIINQANWYRSMRTRLRREFGGLADIFADIIGATSAQTNVQQNYENALQVLRRFTRGEFDEEIAIYQARIDAGKPMGSAELNALHKDENSPFRLITKASGSLFNTNSPAATEALLNMFRQVKVGKAPKTINFTGNLIGFGNEATIDVWAARFLRDAADLPRIPPPAEKAVSGKHLTGSTLEDPRIGAEFGFGQKVFAAAAKQINDSGIIKEVNPELGEIGADDLQAIVWFLEKEKWTKNGWTSKAGEGGSLDYESVYGGSVDRNRVAELRSIINKKGSTPAQIADAKTELETLKGEPQRFVAGISRERPGAVPTNIEQNELAQEILAPVLKDEKMIGVQANSTYGEFDDVPERSINFEVVTQIDFDPTAMINGIVEAGRKYDQDAVFVSKVVADGTPNARPGVEMYFDSRRWKHGGDGLVQAVTRILREKGMDGYTFVTDARQSDRVDVQAVEPQQKFSEVSGTFTTDNTTPELEAQYVGVRFQYVPEFDGTATDPNLQQILIDRAKEYSNVMDEIGKLDGVTYGDVVFYDTKVFKNTDREGAEWIDGGTSYEQQLGKSAE